MFPGNQSWRTEGLKGSRKCPHRRKTDPARKIGPRKLPRENYPPLQKTASLPQENWPHPFYELGGQIALKKMNLFISFNCMYFDFYINNISAPP